MQRPTAMALDAPITQRLSRVTTCELQRFRPVLRKCLQPLSFIFDLQSSHPKKSVSARMPLAQSSQQLRSTKFLKTRTLSSVGTQGAKHPAHSFAFTTQPFWLPSFESPPSPPRQALLSEQPGHVDQLAAFCHVVRRPQHSCIALGLQGHPSVKDCKASRDPRYASVIYRADAFSLYSWQPPQPHFRRGGQLGDMPPNGSEYGSDSEGQHSEVGDDGDDGGAGGGGGGGGGRGNGRRLLSQFFAVHHAVRHLMGKYLLAHLRAMFEANGTACYYVVRLKGTHLKTLSSVLLRGTADAPSSAANAAAVQACCRPVAGVARKPCLLWADRGTPAIEAYDLIFGSGQTSLSRKSSTLLSQPH